MKTSINSGFESSKWTNIKNKCVKTLIDIYAGELIPSIFI